MGRFRRRLRFLLSHSERQRLLWEEMEFHIESMTQAFAAQGLSEVEARAAARRKFGNMTQKSEESRSVWLLRWWSDLAQDLRYAFRGMRRDAAFTVFAILITGLGIGASSTVFSVVNALLLRPLPFREPSRLVWIANQEWSTQVDNFKDLREQNRSFSDLAGWNGFYGAGDWKMTGTGEPERVTGVPVTQNFFPLLGVEPAFGRSFTAEECQQRSSAPPAVLLSNSFWQRRFASDPSVVGRKLMFNNRPVTVVGVMPASFDFAEIFAPGTPVDIFIPWPLTNQTNSQGNTTTIIGRLKPGATVEAARPEFTLLAKQMELQHPERNPVKPTLTPLEQRVNGRVRPALLVLACAVGVVMLIVCANLSNLQMARLGARQKELAMRAALGAGRLRLLRQMFTESIALSCCGAVLGLALAMAGVRVVSHLDAFNLPLLASVRIDGIALAFTLLAAILTGVLFGVLPALQAPALETQDALKEGGRGLSAGRSRTWLRNALVVSEIAFASILLVGAGLLVRSFVRVLDINLGFVPEHTAVLRVDPGSRISTAAQQNAFLDDMLQRARSAPGVHAAGVSDILPFGGDRSWQVSGKGQIYPKDQHPESYIRVVTDGYLEAAGIRLEAGRGFTEQDRASSEPVVIVNQTLARTLWPGQDPLGQIMTQDGGRRVIGVVADVRHEALEKIGGSEMYIPLRQTGDYGAMQLVVRTTLPPEVLASGIRAALRPLDPNLPLTELYSLQDLVDKAMSPRRFLVMLLGGFAAFALLLASLGIYAVISYSVNQRTQEIGLRMALGASPADLQRRILLGTFGLAALGLAIGMAVSRALSNTLESMLFGVTSGDPVTYIGVGALLIAVAAVAGYIPAWRASRIDPMVALRSN
ncbi:MAG: ABC transporter permease [Bryobacteraceae bacterium]